MNMRMIHVSAIVPNIDLDPATYHDLLIHMQIQEQDESELEYQREV